MHTLFTDFKGAFITIYVGFIYNTVILLSEMPGWEKLVNLLIAGIGALALGALGELGKQWVRKKGHKKLIVNFKKMLTNGKQNRDRCA